MWNRLKNLGPGALVAAAFIGPGTITTASISGAQYGYTLLWAVGISILATIVLQEMAARLAVVTGMGLGTTIRRHSPGKIGKWVAVSLVLVSIFIGNAAFEAGNLAGAVLGAEALKLVSTEGSVRAVAILLAVFAAILLYIARYKLIERFLMALVATMGIVFISTAIILHPPWVDILTGLFIPQVPQGSSKMIISLIGTTVVPYNLFLHASSARKKWKNIADLKSARFDISISVLLGGLITMSILICAAVVFTGAKSGGLSGIKQLAVQLEPLLGSWATPFMGIGFLAAGLSSAITAPLAAAFACTEVLGLDSDSMNSKPFRLIWMLVLLTGLIVASLGLKPITVILVAQFANGLILPLIAIILLIAMNSKALMGIYRNGFFSNLIAGTIILISLLLGAKSIIQGLGLW